MNTHIKFIFIAALFFTTSAVYAATNPFDQSQHSDTSEQLVTSETTNSSIANSSEASTESNVSDTEEKENASTSSTETSEEAKNIEESVVEPLDEADTPTDNTNIAEQTSEEPTQEETYYTEETTLVEEQTASETTSEETTPNQQSIQPNQLNINGQFISYTNAGQGNGQAIIDADHTQVATWGGASVQSGEDGSNTHFIGHNPGIFNVLFSVSTGATIAVSDENNTVTNYTVNQIVTVNDSATGTDGVNYWDQITSASGGERITLQTCINDDYNLIIFASK